MPISFVIFFPNIYNVLLKPLSGNVISLTNYNDPFHKPLAQVQISHQRRGSYMIYLQDNVSDTEGPVVGKKRYTEKYLYQSLKTYTFEGVIEISLTWANVIQEHEKTHYESGKKKQFSKWNHRHSLNIVQILAFFRCHRPSIFCVLSLLSGPAPLKLGWGFQGCTNRGFVQTAHSADGGFIILSKSLFAFQIGLLSPGRATLSTVFFKPVFYSWMFGFYINPAISLWISHRNLVDWLECQMCWLVPPQNQFLIFQTATRCTKFHSVLTLSAWGVG